MEGASGQISTPKNPGRPDTGFPFPPATPCAAADALPRRDSRALPPARHLRRAAVPAHRLPLRELNFSLFRRRLESPPMRLLSKYLRSEYCEYRRAPQTNITALYTCRVRCRSGLSLPAAADRCETRPPPHTMVRESDFNMTRTTRPVSRPVRRPAATGPADSSFEWRNNSLPSCVRARDIAESVATAAVAINPPRTSPRGTGQLRTRAALDQPATGRWIVNTLPCPGTLRSVSLPPMPCTMRFARARPSPKPPILEWPAWTDR